LHNTYAPTEIYTLSLHDALPISQLGENVVKEALFARVVCQPAHNVAVRVRGDGIDVWRRVHILLPGSDLDRRYTICRSRSLPGRDRKSTRLNSSHVSISYAVFCL